MNKSTLLAILLLTLGLVGCGDDTAETSAQEPVTEAAPAPATPAPSAGGGGYEPSTDERVPGITMSQEELDKLYEAAKADVPAVTMPDVAKAE